MKISFDGLRQNIAFDFNQLAKELNSISMDEEEVIKLTNQLRSSIGCLLACYDKDQQPDDFNDLSGLELEEL
jgi:hypothetical protein